MNSLSDVDSFPADGWYEINGIAEPTTFRINCNKNNFEVSTITCDHTLPTVSYCFSEVKQKIKPEYAELSPADIIAIKKQGLTLTQEVCSPSFAYICDSSIQVLLAFPQVLTFPVIVIECTFILPEDEQNAVTTKHIHWHDLRPFVLQHPRVTFVLIHFSMRYKECDIVVFFKAEKELYKIDNVKVWAGNTFEQASLTSSCAAGAGAGSAMLCELCGKDV